MPIGMKILFSAQGLGYGKELKTKGYSICFQKRFSHITFGENVTIKSNFLSNLVGLYSRAIIATHAPEAEIEIGDNVGISGATIYVRKNITIGESTCIGGSCKILDNDFHPIEAEGRNKLLWDENGGDSDLVSSREIKISRNGFIGRNSIILKGAVLGDGYIVGAGAVSLRMFIITTDHVGIPDIVEDGVNGIVMSKAENTYKRLLQIDKKQYSDVIEKRIKCVTCFLEKMYIDKMRMNFEIIVGK